MLTCMNDKFSLTSFALTSLIGWCERNKFSLTSFTLVSNTMTQRTAKTNTGRDFPH